MKAGASQPSDSGLPKLSVAPMMDWGDNARFPNEGGDLAFAAPGA